MRFTLLSLLFSLPPLISAIPILNYPIPSQLPLIARPSTPYAWAIFPNTFNSTSSTINYTATGLPTWAEFDPVGLGISGTPVDSDVGVTSVTITATDSTGELSSAFNLLVSANPSPTIHLSLPHQISNPSLHNFNTALSLPSSSGVLLHPYYSFSMGFQQSTVLPSPNSLNDGWEVYYSAHERGTVGLPGWLVFDNETVTFSGVAPSGGSWVVVVVGSDVWGYEAVETSFEIQVSTEYIDVNTTTSTTTEGNGNGTSRGIGAGGLGNITTVAGAMVEFQVNTSAIVVNGQSLASGAGASGLKVEVDLETGGLGWLNFDSATLSLSGTTPARYINGTTTPLSIPLTLSSTTNSSSSASSTLYIPLRIVPSLFTSLNLPNATATPGEAFSYPLGPYLRNVSAIAEGGLNLTVTGSGAGEGTEWIKLDEGEMTISGRVPNVTSSSSRRKRQSTSSNGNAQAVVQIAATDAVTGLMSTTSIDIALEGVAAVPVPTGSATSSSPSETATDAAGNPVAGGKKGGLSNGGKIALGVVFGLLGILLLALLAFCCLRRRKQKKEEGQKEVKGRKSTDSFSGIVKSPKPERDGYENPLAMIGVDQNLPRSGSARLQNGELPTFNSIYIQRPSDAEGQGRPIRADMDREMSQPKRMDAMKGILKWGSFDGRKSGESQGSIPGLDFPSPVPGEIIRSDSLMPPGEGSDFTHSAGSSESRASWESKETFQWSSGEGAPQSPYQEPNGRPLSSAPSIPRPRADFIPRYPRNPSAGGVRPPSEAFSAHTFSEFHDHNHSEGHSSDSMTGTGTGSGGTSFNTGSYTHTHSHTGSGSHSGTSSSNGTYSDAVPRVPAGFTHGPSGLGKIIGDSGHFQPVMEEDGERSDSIDEYEPVPRPIMDRTPRLMPSKERFAQSPSDDDRPHASRTPSQEALAAEAFDDADEDERQRQSTIYAPSELTGLGYPAEAIVLGDPGLNRSSQALTDVSHDRVVSIKAVPQKDAALSPPLPASGNIMDRIAGNTARRPNSSMHDGRYIAHANETFNLHPHIYPPPQVSLSASTWSAPTPSTYRIESADSTPLPSWLHWDGKELEMWGIPALGNAGDIISVRVIERIPKPKRKSYDSSHIVPEEATERDVGSCTIEVTDDVRSPDNFSLEGLSSPPASGTMSSR